MLYMIEKYSDWFCFVCFLFLWKKFASSASLVRFVKFKANPTHSFDSITSKCCISLIDILPVVFPLHGVPMFHTVISHSLGLHVVK